MGKCKECNGAGMWRSPSALTPCDACGGSGGWEKCKAPANAHYDGCELCAHLQGTCASCADKGGVQMTSRDKFEVQYLEACCIADIPADVRAMVLQRNGDTYYGPPSSQLNIAWQAYQWGAQDATTRRQYTEVQQQYIESQHKLLTLGPGFYGGNWVGIAALKAIAEACKE